MAEVLTTPEGVLTGSVTVVVLGLIFRTLWAQNAVWQTIAGAAQSQTHEAIEVAAETRAEMDRLRAESAACERRCAELTATVTKLAERIADLERVERSNWHHDDGR